MPDPDGPKVFVTHKKPHLDEVAAAWLLRSFDPAMRDCEFHYISNTPTGGDVPPGPQYVPVGVGRGKYDEHGRPAGQSATKLVYQDLLHRGLIPNDETEKRAIEILVEFAHREDTGQVELTNPDYVSFSIPAIFRGWGILNPTAPSEAMMTKGLDVLAAVMANLRAYAKFLMEWDHRVEFMSPWGKAVGITTTFRGSDAFAYHHGYALRVQTDPTKPYGDFRGPANKEMDLTTIYEKLTEQEPGRWYLHQSKKLLISNDDPTAGLRGTSLTLQQLIDLVTKK